MKNTQSNKMPLQGIETVIFAEGIIKKTSLFSPLVRVNATRYTTHTSLGLLNPFDYNSDPIAISPPKN